MVNGSESLVDVVQILVLHLVVERADVGFDFGPTEMHFGAVILGVLHFRVDAELISRSENDGLEWGRGTISLFNDQNLVSMSQLATF